MTTRPLTPGGMPNNDGGENTDREAPDHVGDECSPRKRRGVRNGENQFTDGPASESSQGTTDPDRQPQQHPPRVAIRSRELALVAIEC